METYRLYKMIFIQNETNEKEGLQGFVIFNRRPQMKQFIYNKNRGLTRLSITKNTID
jgi:hypothetical protein